MANIIDKWLKRFGSKNIANQVKKEIREFNEQTDCWRCGKPKHREDLCEICYEHILKQKSN